VVIRDKYLLAFGILVIARFDSKSWITVYQYRVKLATYLLQSSKEAFAGHAREKKADPQVGSSVIACDQNQTTESFLEKRWNLSEKGFKHLRGKITIILTSI